MVKVEVKYKARGESEWTSLDIPPADYFWHDADATEIPWNIDSVSEHIQMARLLPEVSVEFATVRISDGSGAFREHAYHYWGCAEDYACIVTRCSTGLVERELIFSGRMPYKENGSQVIRISLDADIPVTTMNCYMWGIGGDEYSESMLAASQGLRGNR